MSARTRFRVVTAVDESPGARAALAAALAFPWPRGSCARAIVARGAAPSHPDWPVTLWRALDASADAAAATARRDLRRRWPDAEARVVDRAPVDAIIAESRQADAVVLGRHGRLVRLLLGSVSRAVIRRARCACLVARTRPRAIRRLVIGVDGSRHARRAVEFVARLEPPAGGNVTIVRVLESMRVPSLAMMPSRLRARITREFEALEARSVRAAERELRQAAARLRRTGWTVRTLIRRGAPLDELLRVVVGGRGHTLVIGARGAGAIQTLLLGSVAQGAVNRARVPVLVVR